MLEKKRVLTCLMNSEPLVVSEISRRTSMNRTAVYRPLYSLEEMGLVTRSKSEKGDVFNAISMDLYKKWRQKKLEEVTADLDDIESLAIASKNVMSPPQVQYYLGAKQVENLYHDSWRNNPEKIIYAITDYDSAYETLGSFMENDYFPERVKRGIRVESILPDSKKGKEDVARAKELLRTMCVLDDIKDIGLEMNIYHDRVSLVQFNNTKPAGILIISETIANSLKKMFTVLWSKGKET